MVAPDEIQIIDATEGPVLPIVEGDGHARAVVWPGTGAVLRSIHVISLRAGARTKELRHPSEAVYYVTEGSGEAIDVSGGEARAVRPGSMVHVDAETAYVLRAGEDGVSLVGGPAPPDPALYEGLG